MILLVAKTKTAPDEPNVANVVVAPSGWLGMDAIVGTDAVPGGSAALDPGSSASWRRASVRCCSMTSDLVHSFIDEVWNQRNLDLLDRLVVDDYQLRNLVDGSVAVRGREELRTHIEEWLAAFPDLQLQETDHLAADQRVASFARMAGSHTGAPFQGFEPTGARVDIAIVAIFDGDGQQLVSHSTLLDARRLVEQLAASHPT